jgi:adenylosuccinate lyase
MLETNNNCDLLTNISPLDGRYAAKLDVIREHSSEFALIKARVYVEAKWLEHLSKQPQIEQINTSEQLSQLVDRLVNNFTLEDARAIKQIEQTTNHDVKAVEYFIAAQLKKYPQLIAVTSFVHFACTSEDINNLAYALMLANIRKVLVTDIQKIISQLTAMAQEYKNVAMLARTHGQAASPTSIGKELANVSYRLSKQLKSMQEVSILGKINGAVGNYNAHLVAYPEINWPDLANEFVSSLGLELNPLTTQIEPHDYIAEVFDAQKRVNTILIDAARDIWSYISIGYFGQKVIAGEVGSSTMPHKVNPIDFENAEGNLGLANALLTHLAAKLPISRMQRDLTDSTVLRNIGVACGYSTLAYSSLLKGLKKLTVNQARLAAELDNNWAVLGEAVQTIMRKYAIADAYEQLKDLTRGKDLNQESYQEFIVQLAIPDDAKQQLLQLTPEKYTGIAAQQVSILD